MASAPAMALIDSFPYNGDDILELRLKTMAPYMDRIYVTEARQTHSGNPKPDLYIDLKRKVFEPYMDKITFLVIDAFPPMDPIWALDNATTPWMSDLQAWWRETYQRNYCTSFIQKDFQDRPFILVSSDVDEIVKPAILTMLKQQHQGLGPREIHLEMTFHYYSLRWKKRNNWYHGIVVSDAALRAGRTLNDMRLSHLTNEISYIQDAGWHLSYFMTVDELVRKLESYSHRENDRPELKSRAWIEKCIAEGLDLFGRFDEDLVECDATIIDI